MLKVERTNTRCHACDTPSTSGLEVVVEGYLGGNVLFLCLKCWGEVAAQLIHHIFGYGMPYKSQP